MYPNCSTSCWIVRGHRMGTVSESSTASQAGRESRRQIPAAHRDRLGTDACSRLQNSRKRALYNKEERVSSVEDLSLPLTVYLPVYLSLPLPLALHQPNICVSRLAWFLFSCDPFVGLVVKASVSRVEDQSAIPTYGMRRCDVWLACLLS